MKVVVQIIEQGLVLDLCSNRGTVAFGILNYTPYIHQSVII